MRHFHTLVVCVLDSSGSMGRYREQAVAGLNAFLDSMRDSIGTISVTMSFYYGQTVYTQYSNKPIEYVEPMKTSQYPIAGSTPLLDGIGINIQGTEALINNLPEDQKPENVMFCIMTDGQENSSVTFPSFNRRECKTLKKGWERVSQLVKYAMTKGWGFCFLGAGGNSMHTADRLGIPRATTGQFDTVKGNIQDAFKQMSQFTEKYIQGDL
jgi:Mg-chelatase subunit ChlD